MGFSFEPQLIKRDSAVPLRMIVGGWIAAVVIIIIVGPVANRVIALMGITLASGGMIGLVFRSTRMYRMVLGASTGAFAAWLGFRFAFSERLIPAVSDPFELVSRDRLGAIVLGLSVLSIGLGGVLEAVRAQHEPGSSPVPIKVFLISVGLLISFGISRAAGVSLGIAMLLSLAAAATLAAIGFLRTERPSTDFVPQP